MSSEDPTFEPVESSPQPTGSSMVPASGWARVLRSALAWALAPTAAFAVGLLVIQALGLNGAWAGPEPQGLLGIVEGFEAIFWTTTAVWLGTFLVGSVYALRRGRSTKKTVLGLAGLLAVGCVIPSSGSLVAFPGIATILDGSQVLVQGEVSGWPQGSTLALGTLFAGLAILGGRSMLEDTAPEIFVYLAGALLAGLAVSVPDPVRTSFIALFTVGTVATATILSMLWLRWPIFDREDRGKQAARYALGMYVLTSGVGTLLVVTSEASVQI